MQKTLISSFLLSTALLSGLEEDPWFGDAYGFKLHTDFAYSQYSKIDRAIKQPSYAYNNYVTDAAISFVIGDNFDFEWELEMARTPHQTYGFRSSAFQGRYLLLDDIAGDFASVALGLNVRGVTGRAVADVSSPYASYWNGEITASIGKEFTKKADWTTRGYLMGSFGVATHGSFWDRYSAVFEAHMTRAQVIKVFTTGYFGYGGEKSVDIEHFQGWGFIAHRSIDIGAQYRYIFDLWGELGLSYACRVLAKSYPQGEQTITLSYSLPFSLF